MSHFFLLKPFYIQPPTPRETESCCCIKCLNIHAIYKSIRKTRKDIPESLTEFLVANFLCEKVETGCHKLSCIQGCCGRNCRIQNCADDLEEDLLALTVKYYIFERTVTSYFNKLGEEKVDTRTARVEKVGTLKEVCQLLLDASMSYLTHRYMVQSDRLYWENFKSQCPYRVVTMDYSENVKLHPKHEVHEAHYSGREHTLHCSIVEKDGSWKFVYHLSDDTNHDSVLTGTILEDIIIQNPEIIASGYLVVRTDNCPPQYKSLHTFQMMKELAIKYGIQISWFYGEAGHGRGLVDAMSHFGVKKPLKDAIVTCDKFFEKAIDMVLYLNEIKAVEAAYSNREYQHVDSSKTALKRITHVKRNNIFNHPIKGSRKMHLISVNQFGSFHTR